MKRVFSMILVCVLTVTILSGCNALTQLIPDNNQMIPATQATAGDAAFSILQSDVALTVGDSMALPVSDDPANVTWFSSDTAVVAVDEGVITAKSAGQAVITAVTHDGKKVTCNVSVSNKEITAITLDKSAVTVAVGGTAQLTASATPAEASLVGLKWTSSNDAIAAVNSDGCVTGVSAGVVNIVCQSENGKEASCTVTVEGSKNDTVINYFYGYGHYHPNYIYSASDFVFPESSMRKLTREEIAITLDSLTIYSPTGRYAQDAVNEIYARNGYIFKSEKLNDYYSSQPWYYPDPSFTVADFSEIEKYNLALLEEFD